jgi:putative membrane protein
MESKIMRHAVFAAATSLVLFAAAPAFAQGMTSADVGIQPLSGVPATTYVKLAADADNFEIQSSRIAATKSKREDVKGFARQMIVDHTTTSKSLAAALNNADRKITPPSTKLSTANQAKIDLLKKAPKGSFDQLYLQQQLQAHQTAWALHSGYAAEGTDPSLKQVATTAVPVIEHHLSMVKGMTPGAM